MEEELQIIETEHGVFTNNPLSGETAEEIYQGWLANRDNPPNPKPTENELIKQELISTQSQLLNLQKLCVNLQKQILLK